MEAFWLRPWYSCFHDDFPELQGTLYDAPSYDKRSQTLVTPRGKLLVDCLSPTSNHLAIKQTVSQSSRKQQLAVD